MPDKETRLALIRAAIQELNAEVSQWREAQKQQSVTQPEAQEGSNHETVTN